MPHAPPHETLPADRAPDPRRPLALRLVAFVGAMSLAVGAALLPTSALFAVETVAVAGDRSLAGDEIVARAGVRPGARLFSVDPGAVARRIERDPRIARAEVRLRLPDRVEITVTERAPVAALRLDGAYLLVDAGTVPIARRPTPSGLPIVDVEDLAPPWIQLGHPLPAPAAAVALEALLALPDDLAAQVASLHLDRGREVTLHTRDRIKVRVGPAQRVAARAALLPQILDAIRSQRLAVKYVDVRFGGNVVVKPAEHDAGR